jgi:hypothetical protein
MLFCAVMALLLVVIPVICIVGAAIQSCMGKLAGIAGGVLLTTAIITTTIILTFVGIISLIIFII